MSAKKKVKVFSLDVCKVKRVQKILGAETETEAIEQALDAILIDDRIDRRHEELVRSKISIQDTLGRLPQ